MASAIQIMSDNPGKPETDELIDDCRMLAVMATARAQVHATLAVAMSQQGARLG